jgi:hypothetical protein
MKPAIAQRNTTKQTNLSVIKGGLYPDVTIEKLAKIAWRFAYIALWNGVQFSQRESNTAKQQITTLLQQSKDAKKGFQAFCQRVILARTYVQKHSNRYIPLPTDWLDANNTTGFAGTQQWLADIQAIRNALPNYKIELKALAEAILEFTEEPTTKNYRYWTQYFMDKQAINLLQLFQIMAAQNLYQP